MFTYKLESARGCNLTFVVKNKGVLKVTFTSKVVVDR